MKVKICNLGVVEEAEINLKPLTVFIGHNNTGKTWTAYTVAGLFGKYGYARYVRAYFDGRTQKYPALDTAIQQLIERGNSKLNFVDFANEYSEAYFNDVARLLPLWMPTYMATEKAGFDKLCCSVFLENTKSKILNLSKYWQVDAKLSASKKNEALVNILKKGGEEEIYFYTTSTKELITEIPDEAIKRFTAELIFGLIHQSIYFDIYLFPAERTTLIALPIVSFLLQQEDPLEKSSREENPEERKRIEESRKEYFYASTPTRHFLETLETALYTNLLDRENQSETDPLIRKYMGVSEVLENDILDGKLEREKTLRGNKINFRIAPNTLIDISIASSMVKELASLVLYLRYIARPNHLIVIDEPEMNLHPAAQVEIIEFLAMLVQAGLNVLITTHSPYIVDHLANLMQAAKYEDKESIKERFYLERTEAFIPQEKVSVYLFEDGTAKNILSEDGRIDWGTFANVSDDISHIFP
jgi:AAA15 family ATPase/GTPase